MLFTKLKLNYFGKFQNKEIELKPGINLIYGENEAGKSTIHTFIRGMLFGIERLRGRGSASKEDSYTRYLPWDYPGAYSGSMDIRIGDKEYRLQRSFHANDKSFAILDLSTGREVKLKEGLISELIPGLTEGAYKNTISIEQLKAQTDAELAAQVRNYITNLSIAKNKEVNVAKAVSMLTEQRKQLEASQNTTALKELQSVINEGMVREERIDKLTIHLREMFREEQILKEQGETALSSSDNEAASRMEQLPAILEKYNSYQELIRQEGTLEAQSRELEAKISVWDKQQQANATLKENMTEVSMLQEKLLELEKQETKLQEDRENCKREGKRNLLISLVPSWVIALFIIVIMWLINPAGMVFSSAFFLAGIVGYAILSRNNRKKQRALSDSEVILKKQKDTVQVRFDDILRKSGVSKIEGLFIKQEEALRNTYALEHTKEQRRELERRKSGIEESLDVMYETIMKYMQYFVREEELTPASMHKLQEEIIKRKQDSLGKHSEINRQYENCKLGIEKLKWEIATLEGNEEELLKNREKYRELEQRQMENMVELNAVNLALSTINELSVDIHDNFGQKFNKAVSEIISGVTGNRYTDLKVDEKLAVKVGWNKDYILLERLSAGTIDQVYFALRMAVADLLLGKDEVPLLLDDSFALYDETRVKAVLTELAQRKQVVLFTCHKREQLLLKEMGLQHHFIDLSC